MPEVTPDNNGVYRLSPTPVPGTGGAAIDSSLGALSDLHTADAAELSAHVSDEDAHGLADLREDVTQNAYNIDVAIGQIADKASGSAFYNHTIDPSAHGVGTISSNLSYLENELGEHTGNYNAHGLDEVREDITQVSTNLDTAIGQISGKVNNTTYNTHIADQNAHGLAALRSTVAGHTTSLASTYTSTQVDTIAAAKLSKASNLSDLANAATARTNLGLGTAATANATSFEVAGAAAVVQANLTTHTSSTGNVHSLTPAQLGALALTGGTLTGLLTGTAIRINGTSDSPQPLEVYQSQAGKHYGVSVFDSGNTRQASIYSNGDASFTGALTAGSLKANGGILEGNRFKAGASDFYIETSGADRIKVMQAGNVLIGTGTDAGTGKLQVAGTVAATAFAGTGASLTSLNGSNITSGTVSANWVADLSGYYLPRAGGYVGPLQIGDGAENGSIELNDATSEYKIAIVAADGGMNVNYNGGYGNYIFNGNLQAQDFNATNYYGTQQVLEGGLDIAESNPGAGYINLNRGLLYLADAGDINHRLNFDDGLDGPVLQGYSGVRLQSSQSGQGIQIDSNGSLSTDSDVRVGYDLYVSAWQLDGNTKAYCRAIMASDQNYTGSFQTIDLYAAVDAGGNWYNEQHYYVVPISGIYSIVTKVRLADGTSPGSSYGQGAHTSNADGAWFLWGATNGMREGLLNTRVAYFAQGDQIRLYMYSDSGYAIIDNAEMTINLVGITEDYAVNYTDAQVEALYSGGTGGEGGGQGGGE